jgi:hypothetical protein
VIVTVLAPALALGAKALPDQVLRQIPSEEMLAIAKAVDRFELTLLRNQA